MANGSWEEVAPGSGVYTLEYDVPSVGITANSVAFPMGEGKLGVLSPASTASDASFEQLAGLGEVVAVIAPNVGHDLGLRPWMQRFPGVPFYGTAATAKSVAKSKKDLRPLAPLDELAARLPEGVRIWESPGSRAGTVFLRVSRGGHEVLYLDDLVGHLHDLPPKQPFRFFFWVTGSAPGLRLSKVFKLFFVKDGPAMKASLLDDARAHPPSVLLFAHGSPHAGTSVAELEQLLAPLG